MEVAASASVRVKKPFGGGSALIPRSPECLCLCLAPLSLPQPVPSPGRGPGSAGRGWPNTVSVLSWFGVETSGTSSAGSTGGVTGLGPGLVSYRLLAGMAQVAFCVSVALHKVKLTSKAKNTVNNGECYRIRK